MPYAFHTGDIAWIVENGYNIRKVRILRISAGFATLRFSDNREAGCILRVSRLFPSKAEAEKSLKETI